MANDNDQEIAREIAGVCESTANILDDNPDPETLQELATLLRRTARATDRWARSLGHATA